MDGAKKKRLGRLAYLRAGAKALGTRPVRMKIRVDGTVWFEGQASSVLIGNVGTVMGGFEVFPDASSADGILDAGADRLRAAQALASVSFP